jgi:hypothetical protein
MHKVVLMHTIPSIYITPPISRLCQLIFHPPGSHAKLIFISDTADRGGYKNETYLLAILPHILNT